MRNPLSRPGAGCQPVLPTVLATGAWLKNAACLLDGGSARWSPQHGDLGDPAACAALERSLQSLQAGAVGRISAVAHDLHPDFFSTRLALAWADTLQVPAIGVQHHHAHIAAVMAEHALAEPVIGLALDGVGLGDDGQAWGGELLWVAPEGWRRLGHCWPLALPGGDAAAREPWRMAASVLHALGRGGEIEARFGPSVGVARARQIHQLLVRQLNCPMTSSAGRWFDAAAAALGLSLHQADEAEAAIALQRQAQTWIEAHGDHCVARHGPLPVEAGRLDLRPLLGRMFDTPPERVAEAAAGFHLGLADALADWAAAAASAAGVGTVCLAGGCFFNPVLRDRITQGLEARGLRVYRPQAHSCGDAGLALGQAWVAAHQIHPQHRPDRAAVEPNESPPCASPCLPC